MLRIRSISASNSSDRRDQGFAVVVAILVSMIAFLIMTAVLAESIHNITQSGYGRRRIAAVNAAEAGLNWFANAASGASLTYLSSPGLQWTRNSGWYIRAPQPASGSPDNATFQVFVRYSLTSPCSTLDDLRTCQVSNMSDPAVDLDAYEGPGEDPFPDPVYAIVRSVGVAGAAERALEAYVRLRANRTAVTGGLSAISLCLGPGAKVSVQGDLAINNQKIGAARPQAFKANCPTTWSTGNLVLEGGQYLRTFAGTNGVGNLYIKGGGLSVTGQRYAKISGRLWVEDSIELGCSGAGCSVKPSSSCVNTGTIQCVEGDALGQSIKQGTAGHIVGVQTTCNPACSPPANFTEIRWDPANPWPNWVVVEVTDTSAANMKSQIEAPTSPTVLHISGPSCDVTLPSGTLTLKTSVALVSECRFSFRPPGTALAKSPATCTTCSLLVFSVIPMGTALTSVQCGSPTWSSPGSRDVSIEGNQNFGSIGFFIYTPCYLWIQGNQCNGCTTDPTPSDIDTSNGQTNDQNEVWIQGQFIGRYLILKNGVRLIQNDIGQYLTVLPGTVTSFKQDVKFIREIPVADVFLPFP